MLTLILFDTTAMLMDLVGSAPDLFCIHIAFQVFGYSVQPLTRRYRALVGALSLLLNVERVARTLSCKHRLTVARFLVVVVVV